MQKTNSSCARGLTIGGLLIAAGWSFALSGCSIPIPQAEKDPTRYYVLSSTSSAATPKADAPVVQLRAIELASYLGSRPMIVRRGDNEIEFREFARWGESLDAGIARVLREELVARGAARAVVAPGGRREPGGPEFTLSVRVLACEGASGGGVAFRAAWELTSGGATPTPVAGGDFRAADLRWDGKSEASLAAQLSQAVAQLAGEIATALKK